MPCFNLEGLHHSGSSLTLSLIGPLSVKLLQAWGFGFAHWSFLYGGFIVGSLWRYASCTVH